MLRFVGIAGTLLFATACVETCFADQVSMNVARLTVMNADAAITALANDTICGFASPEVTGGRVIEGTPPGEGTLTLIVSNCEIVFDEPTVTSTNCHDGIETVAYGRVFFPSATLTVVGTLLPSDETPIIPSGPDAITISAEAEFDNWEAADTDQDAYMIWVDGGLSGTLSPRLAAPAAGLGCAVQTGNKAFWNVIYEPSSVQIVADLLTLDIEVDSSNLWGAQGIHRLPEDDDLPVDAITGEFIENVIAGEISIWGQAFTLPIDSDDDGLDPDYDAQEFVLSDECRVDDEAGPIAVPINYDCGY